MRDFGNALAWIRVPGMRGGQRPEAETVEASPPVRWLIRSGFVARGLTYGVIGGLALALALGAGTMGADPSQEGALALIARAPLGRAALVVVCAGLLAYAVWKLTQAVLGRGPEGGGGSKPIDRASNFGGGVAYLAFFGVGVLVIAGSAGNSSSGPRDAAADVLRWPAGQVIVAIVGGALIAISLYQLYDALRGAFAKDSKTGRMGTDERRVFTLLGKIGLSARALVFALVGYFLLRTAIEFKASNAVGVDGALARLHQQPLGPWLLGLAGVGLLTFAAFSMFEARYRRL